MNERDRIQHKHMIRLAYMRVHNIVSRLTCMAEMKGNDMCP